MKKFYLAYHTVQSAVGEWQNDENSAVSISATPLRKFNLSWSHYLKLMHIENPNERRFYEIECAINNWSLKELQRQCDAALYERLALSRDKAGIKQLAEQGQIIEKSTDILKDPLKFCM